MNGTRWAISPATKATSRESRSSFETKTAAFGDLCGGQRRRELRPAIEGISALARFGLDIFADDGEALGLGKARNGGELGFNPESRAVLLLCRDTVVGNSAFHTNGIPPFAVVWSDNQSNAAAFRFFSLCCTANGAK
jgi:hypothetical protein